MYRIYVQNDFDFSLVKGPPLIYISDIDETYLQTDFKTVRGLITSAIQFAIDKVAYPDMALFYRIARDQRDCALYFISSSPVQLKDVLQKKFLLDEIPYDGLILRDTFHLMLTGHGDEVRNPFGYKLYALLGLMADFPDRSRIVLIGDDTESDAEIYRTLRGFAQKRLGRSDFEARLAARNIHPQHIPPVLDRLRKIEGKGFEIPAIFIRVTGSGTGPSVGRAEDRTIGKNRRIEDTPVESDRAESGRTESGMTESDRAESGRTESGMTESDRAERDRTGASRADGGGPIFFRHPGEIVKHLHDLGIFTTAQYEAFHGIPS
jgi:hypothetical protein